MCEYCYQFFFFFCYFMSFLFFFFFFFNDTATTEIYTLSLHDALPIYHELEQVVDELGGLISFHCRIPPGIARRCGAQRSEEHTSELQSRLHLVCRLLLEKKKKRSMQVSYYIRQSETSSSSIFIDGN